MNWIEKVEFMIAEKKRMGYCKSMTVDIRCRENTWRDGELESIVASYSWLPQAYIDFIKQYDNIGIAWVAFYGSEAGNIVPLGKEIEFLTGEGLPNEYFPFGKYVDGSIFVFDKIGKVYLFDIGDYEFKEPENVAKSFDDFMENCLFKDRLGSLESTKSTSFYQFLQAQGWA